MTAKANMKYALKVMWHGAILVINLGTIALGVLIPFFLRMTNEPVAANAEESDMPEKPNPADFNHPNWSYYYGQK